MGGVPSRLKHCVDMFRDVRLYCKEHDVSLVVHAGDLFHKRGVLYTQSYNLVVEELAAMRKSGITVLANVGNHDQADRAGEVHCLQAMQSAGLLETVGRLGWRMWWPLKNEAPISLIAYCDSLDTFKSRVSEAASRAPGGGLLVCHHGFTGARVGSSLEYAVREEISTKVLADFPAKRIYSGHYHAHQIVGKKTKVTYVGSPMEFVRGDGVPGQDKGFLVYDTETGEHELVPLRRPRFVTLSQEDLADDDFDVAGHVRGNYVDVHYDEMPVAWAEVEALLVKYGAEGVKACPRPKQVADKARLRVDPHADQRALIEKYLDYRDAPRDDRPELMRTGLDLLQRSEA